MPDAWDDDWIAKGNSTNETRPSPSSTKISKAERRAKQAEFNRQLWEDAEDPQDNFFLKSRDAVPLKSDFKPAVKVLSRKPEKKKSAASVDGIGQLIIDDDDESEEENKKPEMTAEERREKAQRELEEKQKKYEEVKQRLFGNDQSSSSPSTTPTSGPNKNTSKNSSPSRNQSWNKNSRDSRPSSSLSNKTGRLYDPNEPSKSGVSSVLRKETTVEPDELQPIRSPRGPDTSGRGGFGFAPRGGKSA